SAAADRPRDISFAERSRRAPREPAAERGRSAAEGGCRGGARVSRINRLLCPALFGIAIVSAFFAPRLVDYALGVVFLAAAARGLWGPRDRPSADPDGPRGSTDGRVMAVGIFGLFGGGAIAWGWITAARASAGVVGLALLAAAYAKRDSEATGCAVLLG